MLHPKKQLELWEFTSKPLPDGKLKGKSKPSGRQRVKDGTISLHTSKPIPPSPPGIQLELPLFCTPEFPPIAKETISLDKLRRLLNDTQGARLSQKLEADSILGGEDCSPFWNELSLAISSVLSLPTKTALPDLDLTSSNGCVKNSAVKSWFSINKSTVHKPNSCKICCQLSTVSVLAFTDSVSTKSNLDQTRKFKQKKRHSHKRTDKPQPNFVRKVRIYPDQKLAAAWRHWLAGCRFVYNRAIETLKSGFKGSSYDLEAQVLNNLPDWLKTVPRHPKANAVQDANDAWVQAKANAGEAKFRSCRQPTQSIKFKVGNYLHGTWFPQLTKGMTLVASQPLADNCDYGTQLVRDRRRWFAILPEFVPTSQTKQAKVIALDPGIRTFLTGYDGEAILEIGSRSIERVVRLCFHLDRLISRATQKSVRAKQRRSMLRAAGRIRIQIRNLVDELHRQTVSYLIRNYKVIFLPTFDTSQMVVKSKRRINKKSARSMLTWGHYRFKQLLKSMADRSGVMVVEINEAYTSKTCGRCGHIHPFLGGSKKFKCFSCGFTVDRDWNGAFNIMLKALAGTPFTLAGDAIEVFEDVAVIE